MGTQNHTKALRSLQRRIAEHEDKINKELQKDYPDQGLIKLWQTEIRAFEKGVQQALKRLRRL